MNPNRCARVAIRLAVVAAAALFSSGLLHAQEEGDGGVSYDGRGNILLESVYVPELPGAPFSVVLTAEWTRPTLTGATFTIVNARPIRRDSQGRIYQERWLMVPKGSDRKSTMSGIQIEDPVAGLFYQCGARQKICEVHRLGTRSTRTLDPAHAASGNLSNGRGYRTHEDMGVDTVAGVPVHAYRDTVVLNPGTTGNDRPLTFIRDVRYAPGLGFNLTSILQSPAVGEQRFAATEITTSEPEGHWFQPPAGYRLVDMQDGPVTQP